MTYLTDTTFVIDYLRGQVYAQGVLPELLRHGLAVSIVSYMELWEGVLGDKDPVAAEQRLRTFLRPLTILPLSRRASVRTARLRRHLRLLGHPIHHRALDLLIAGTALEADLVMVTNDADFRDIPELKLFDPRTGSRWQNPA